MKLISKNNVKTENTQATARARVPKLLKVKTAAEKLHKKLTADWNLVLTRREMSIKSS